MCWFVAYSKSRNEFKAANYFDKCGINSYVPSYEEKREWSDRVKKIKAPAISGYVFFELNKLDYSLVNSNPFIRNVLKQNGKPITITLKEIDTLKTALCEFNIVKNVHSGDNVKILTGLFKNKTGLVDFVDNQTLTLLINSIKVKLSLADTRLRAVV
ncbi:hypothetical protein N9546_00280 [Flavobacteriaceae bacterium]|nr:hypothetical protein [Flavobacteriaceae bacterium]